jgi:hypothetical protein
MGQVEVERAGKPAPCLVAERWPKLTQENRRRNQHQSVIAARRGRVFQMLRDLSREGSLAGLMQILPWFDGVAGGATAFMDAARALRSEFMGWGIAMLLRFRFQLAPGRWINRAFENTQVPAIGHDRPDDIASHRFLRGFCSGAGCQEPAQPALMRINSRRNAIGTAG